MHTYTEHNGGGNMALMGFVAGFLGGAVMALLYAPSSGRDTRSYLARRAREGTDHVRETAEQRFRETAEQGRNMFEQGKSAVDRGREALSNAVSEGREAYRQAKGNEAI
jgi:gas vesicle protein